MSIINFGVTTAGTGTKTFSTGSTNVAVTAPAGEPGDLLIVACYTSADATLVKDAGDGWIILSSGYDAVNGYGIFLAVLISRQRSPQTYAGLTLPSSAAYTAQTQLLRLRMPFTWDLAVRASGEGWYNNIASDTNLEVPQINQPYAQCIDLLARGYNNGGVTTTVATPSGFAELFDTGQTSPPHGIVCNRASFLVLSAVQNPPVASALAVAKTNRAGVRGMIGITANVMAGRGRYGSGRRAF